MEESNLVSQTQLELCEKDKAVLINDLEIVKEQLIAVKSKAINRNRLLKLFLLSSFYLHLTLDMNFELLGDGSKLFYLRRREVDNWVTYLYAIGCLVSILDKEQFDTVGKTINNFLPTRTSV